MDLRGIQGGFRASQGVWELARFKGLPSGVLEPAMGGDASQGDIMAGQMNLKTSQGLRAMSNQGVCQESEPL